MKDQAAKQAGTVHTTSRGWTKAYKHRTKKVRRQLDKLEVRDA